MDFGMILLYEIGCLQAMCWEILCIYFGPMEQWVQKLIFSWWLFKIDLIMLLSWQMPCLALALNLLAHLLEPHMSRNCWTTSFFKVQCTKVLHGSVHLWFGWFGLPSKLCWLEKMYYKTKLPAFQRASNCAARSAPWCTLLQLLRTMHFCFLLKSIVINVRLMWHILMKQGQRTINAITWLNRCWPSKSTCIVKHTTLFYAGRANIFPFFCFWDWFLACFCFCFPSLLHQSFQESKHKCFKSFLGTRLLGQVRDDHVWHASLLVWMWEAQCESLRSHDLVPCKLFERPKRIRCSKHTIFVGTVCYVIHAKQWCLVTSLFQDVGKVVCQAAVLRLKFTNHFTSVFENTKMLIGFELSSNVNLMIPNWRFHTNLDITTLHWKNAAGSRSTCMFVNFLCFLPCMSSLHRILFFCHCFWLACWFVFHVFLSQTKIGSLFLSS